MGTEDNEAIARRELEELWIGGHLALVDELYAPDVVDHHPLPGQVPGREGVRQAIALINRVFPCRGTIEGTLAAGDTVARWWTMRGTHEAEFLGLPATHRPATLTGIDVLRIVDGKIVELWHEEDLLGLLLQLGATIAPPAGGGEAADVAQTASLEHEATSAPSLAPEIDTA